MTTEPSVYKKRRAWELVSLTPYSSRRPTRDPCSTTAIVMARLVKLVVLWWAIVNAVDAHGYMSSPAARNSAWRFGFDTPANYNDNELFCGGREVSRTAYDTTCFYRVHHFKHGGRCGVCGDNWGLKEPRPHERGGRYGRGVITARYNAGQVLPLTLHLSANHRGWYEFRLCNNNNPAARDSQRCLDKHLLPMADGSGTRYFLDGSIRGDHTVHVQLPRHLTCSHCVLQWKWVVGNTWGTCPDGSGANGCGPQETFINCADISILPKHHVPPPHKGSKLAFHKGY